MIGSLTQTSRRKIMIGSLTQASRRAETWLLVTEQHSPQLALLHSHQDCHASPSSPPSISSFFHTRTGNNCTWGPLFASRTL